jgi:Phage derived protein Gp49-like (DUF891)
VLIGEGRWKVYAVCSDETTCPLLDLIDELDEKRAAKVLSDLRTYVPDSDPGEWVRNKFSWLLRGSNSILEFRWKTKKGGTPRVYWFYDEQSVIVCSHGTNKKGDTDEADIRRAESIKKLFAAARKGGQLKIVKLADFDPSETEENTDG